MTTTTTISDPDVLSAPRPVWGGLEWLVTACVIILPMLRASIFREVHVSISAYYILLSGSLLIVLLRGMKQLRFQLLLSALVICAFLSIVFNDIPAYFHAEQRLIGWILVLGLCSCWLKNDYCRQFRARLCRGYDTVLMIVVIASCIGHFSKLTPQLFEAQANGLFSQPMLLGPIASIASLLFLHRFVTAGSRHRLWWGAGLLAACLMVLLASSRGALFSLLVAMCFYLLIQFGVRKAIFYVLLLVGLAVATSSYWEGYTEGLQKKFDDGIERSGSLFDSRQQKWELRLEEIRERPVFGYGFTAVSADSFFWLDDELAGVEPGSSWLFVPSSLGIPAGILFIVFMMLPFIRFFRHKARDGVIVLRIAILLFFCGHLCIEGYILSAGSPLCILFWLYTSQVYDFWHMRSKAPAENRALLPDSASAFAPVPAREGV